MYCIFVFCFSSNYPFLQACWNFFLAVFFSLVCFISLLVVVFVLSVFTFLTPTVFLKIFLMVVSAISYLSPRIFSLFSVFFYFLIVQFPSFCIV